MHMCIYCLFPPYSLSHEDHSCGWLLTSLCSVVSTKANTLEIRSILFTVNSSHRLLLSSSSSSLCTVIKCENCMHVFCMLLCRECSATPPPSPNLRGGGRALICFCEVTIQIRSVTVVGMRLVTLLLFYTMCTMKKRRISFSTFMYIKRFIHHTIDRCNIQSKYCSYHLMLTICTKDM